MIKTIFLAIMLSSGVAFAHCGSCGAGEGHKHSCSEKNCTECECKECKKGKECKDCKSCSDKKTDKKK